MRRRSADAHCVIRFGRGFQLDVSTGGRGVDKVRQWAVATFAGCMELECYGSFIKFRIPPQNMSLAEVSIRRALSPQRQLSVN